MSVYVYVTMFFDGFKISIKLMLYCFYIWMYRLKSYLTWLQWEHPVHLDRLALKNVRFRYFTSYEENDSGKNDEFMMDANIFDVITAILSYIIDKYIILYRKLSEIFKCAKNFAFFLWNENYHDKIELSINRSFTDAKINFRNSSTFCLSIHIHVSRILFLLKGFSGVWYFKAILEVKTNHLKHVLERHNRVLSFHKINKLIIRLQLIQPYFSLYFKCNIKLYINYSLYKLSL